MTFFSPYSIRGTVGGTYILWFKKLSTGYIVSPLFFDIFMV